MKLLFSIILFCFFVEVDAQDNYAYADGKALQIPDSQSYSTTGIASYIREHFTTEKEKTRAVYTWITHNIAYSKDSITYFNRWGIDPEINMNAILRRRKGGCENYAALFANILLKTGVQAVVVTGYTNLPANNYWNGHGWVAVRTNGDWSLCDPTWDAGYNTYHYFLAEPSEFIETHMPFDPMWQLLEHPVSHTDFQKGRYRSTKDSSAFHFKDSVASWLQSDTLQQMEAASRRIGQTGFTNEDVKTWYSYNQMKVHIVLQEENMQLFNEAVEHLNTAKKLYNEFVQYRNNLFTTATQNTSAAYEKAALVGKKSENYQYDTEGLQQSLDALAEKIKAQQDWWKTYQLSNEKRSP